MVANLKNSKIVATCFCFIFFCILNARAQGVNHSNCNHLPMKSGEISYSSNSGSGKRSITTFLVASNTDKVYALTDGKVLGGPEMHNYKTIGVEYNTDTLIIYLMLKDVALKVGDSVKKGDIIGSAIHNDKTGKNESAVLMKLPYQKMQRLSDADVMAFVSRMDK